MQGVSVGWVACNLGSTNKVGPASHIPDAHPGWWDAPALSYTICKHGLWSLYEGELVYREQKISSGRTALLRGGDDKRTCRSLGVIEMFLISTALMFARTHIHVCTHMHTHLNHIHDYVVLIGTHTCVTTCAKTEDNLQEPFFTFYHVNLRN